LDGRIESPGNQPFRNDPEDFSFHALKAQLPAFGTSADARAGVLPVQIPNKL